MNFQPEPLPELPLTLEQSIARFEGFYAMGETANRPQRCNNPGDIEFGQFAQLHGATHGDPRFAVFPTPEIGFACLSALLRTPTYSEMTVRDAINRYAPPNENATTNYVLAVCKWSECQPDDRVIAVLNRGNQ